MADKFKDEPQVQEEAEDAEVVKLQEKANMLKKFVSLMEEGVKDAAKTVPTLQEARGRVKPLCETAML